jgi:ferredoxin-NADP reductase
MFQQNHTMQGHSPMNHFRPSKKRVAFEVALKEKKQIAEGTIAFIFEKPNGFHMRAGQHVRMTLIDPPETDSEGNSRFFSLANSPQEADLVIALRMRDTAFKRVLGRMQIGDEVRIETLLKSPHGSFALHDDASKPTVFLIGGIGIVPAFSMIKDALERKLPHPLFLFYSNRRAEDAPFLEELETLAKQHPSFKLIATLTEPEKQASSWGGETGRIDHSMIKRYVDDLTSPIYYIAGLPEMVSAMKTVLTDLGVSEDNIRAEEFTGFIMGQDGPMGQHDMTHSNKKRMRPLLLVAMVLLIIVVVSLHAVGAISLSKTSFGAFSLNNSIFYVLIGLFFAFVLFKFKHLLGLLHRKEKQPAREMSHGISSTDGVLHEQRQEELS